MENRTMNEAESLALISRMIQNARISLNARINSNVLLVWGYITVIVAIAVWLLKWFNVFPLSSLLWLLIPAVCLPVTWLLSAKDPSIIKSYLDRIIDYLSLLYVIVATTVAFSSIMAGFSVFFIEGLLVSLWIFTIGLLLKFKPVVAGGIAGVVIAHAILFIPDPIMHIPVFAGIMVVAGIVPGHIFKRAISKKQASCLRN